MPAPFASSAELEAAEKGVLSPLGDRVQVLDPARLRGDLIDRLVRTAVFATDEALRDLARRRVRAAGEAVGVVSASIDPLYRAMGRGEVKGFTVPAVNVRALVYDFARAIAATAVKEDVGAVIFELARSEMGYTAQSCAEFSAVVTAAAVKEGWEGPLFLQGDHFQVNAKKYAVDPEAEVGAVRTLCEEAVAAGYGNIDVDTSTIVDLSKPTLDEQQRQNYTHAAELTARIREIEPAGMTISVGGEIGEVGLANSTVGELRAYMEGYRAKLEAIAPGAVGISKISVQTGTSHGGIPLPDGTVADVEIDFHVLRELSSVARAEYGIAGCVQHGASTLPEEVFHLFPTHGTAEIHLATAFQTLILAHPAFPKDLLADIDAWCAREKKGERKPGQTDAQFLYKTRKFAWGAFKRRCWDLPEADRAAIRASLSSRISMLFGSLHVHGTRATVRRHASVPARTRG